MQKWLGLHKQTLPTVLIPHGFAKRNFILFLIQNLRPEYSQGTQVYDRTTFSYVLSLRELQSATADVL